MTNEENNLGYAVTAGCYSDYHVIAIFSDKEKAEAYAKAHNDVRKHVSHADNAEVEEFSLNPEHQVYPANRFPYDCYAEKNGEVTVFPSEPTKDMDILKPSWIASNPNKVFGMSLCCWAKDEQHAVKIFSERRARAIADGSWDAEIEAYIDSIPHFRKNA